MKPLTQEQFEAIRDWVAQYSSVILANFIETFQPKPEQQTLIPFDLTAALKHPDRVVYRDGSKPLEWHWFKSIKFAFRVITSDGEFIYKHREDGTFSDNPEIEAKQDLFLLPEAKKEYWVNVYVLDGEPSLGKCYQSEGLSIIKRSAANYLKTISFTI